MPSTCAGWPVHLDAFIVNVSSLKLEFSLTVDMNVECEVVI